MLLACREKSSLYLSLLHNQNDKVTLASPLDPGECLARLRTATQSEWRLFGKYPVVASLGESSFRIRKRRSVKFQTVLYGNLMDDRSGTRIECRIGVERLAAGIAGAWSLFAAGSLVFTLVAERGDTSPHGIVANVAIMTLAGLTVTIGCAFARVFWNDDEFLLDFLQHAIDARPVDRQEPATVRHRFPR